MKITNETKVGVLAAVAITVLIVGYSFLKGNDVFSRENEFYAIYTRVDGLTVSKPVLVNGYQIGRVSNLTLQPDGRILVQFKVNPEYAIPKNTIAKLESTDLLGGKVIVFELGSGSDFAADGDTLNANVKRDLMDQVEPVQKKAEQIIARMDSVLTSVNNTLNPEFQRNFDRSFASIARTLETLEKTTRTVDGLVTNQSSKISGIMTNLESISSNFKSNNESITKIVTNFERISDDVAKANFAQTITEANKAVADLQTVINKVNSGNGTLGQLINDERMYNNLNNAAANLDKLMIDLKANPKRYVSFSVFGGKKD
ncbi:MlaD family protein [Daejeonella sp.]|uniref:MlaD family protein n=1 Tax=Daejeonella sp. TaxID=2805397 RepID=UPI002730CDC4|nr:MlaD family protein [Daejeonella sp.]MDP2413615.1 MlaD family protein [Daejeonella sp.]